MNRPLCALLAVVMIFSASCGFIGSSAALKNKNDDAPFRIGLAENSELCGFTNITQGSFHPHHSCLQLYLAFETLAETIQRDASTNALRISDDGRECVVTLPKGVFFHDGQELTADDVVYSLDSMKKIASSDAGKYLYFPLSDMAAVKLGDREVLLHSRHPQRFASLLGNIIIIGKNRRNISGVNGNEIFIPTGTGPYSISGVDMKNRKIMMEGSANYGPVSPKIKKIEIVFRNNLEMAAMALLADEVDYVPVFGDIENEMISTSRNHRLLRYRSFYNSALVLNTTSPKLRDARVRRALSMIVDRQSMSKNFRGLPETRMPTSSLFNFSYPETPPDADSADTKGAIKLLREAGYKLVDGKLFLNGKRMELEISILGVKDSQYVIDAIRLLVKSWEDAGISCSFKSVSISDVALNRPYEALFAQLRDGDVNFILDKVLNSSDRGGLFNLDFRDEKLDRLREEFKNEHRENVLREKKLEIQARLKETCPIIPLYYDYGFAAVGGRFSGDEMLVAALSKDPGLMTHFHEYR